jgi:UDP-N-acetylglucosamine 2-epimerase (non-hydrolysing)
MRICNVVGARPNFMKMAPVIHELARRGVDQRLVHTGQHYDESMSDVFFAELGMPRPDVHLRVGSGTHAGQTAAVMVAFERVIREGGADLIIVAGDVNSTLAVALVAAKLLIPVAHVEAGLRSFDRAMPEEVNRVVTDHLSQLLLATEVSGVENLHREGIPDDRIHMVGNCMVDSLIKHLEAAVAREPWREFGFEPSSFALLTLHRPSNVDDDETLQALIGVMGCVARKMPILFPAHPRTRERLRRAGIRLAPGLRLTPPLPYLSFLGLMARSCCVLTDSGGIQEETTALGIPCLTLRENTERPVTVESGTNRLVGNDAARIEACIDEIIAGRWPSGRRPPLWDGRASVRIADVILSSSSTGQAHMSRPEATW